ncbi:hypothetical protein RF11_15529 [Thelohanellus kitauei]|uniref:Uncharacterized protein n=1 Tax=Thelohanellus kitauei TaxID=669202 RepID=A0A0C2NFR9_THEKT|nr:hypothetical protein RF11_15529 [Thelohanellus kitauei]
MAFASVPLHRFQDRQSPKCFKNRRRIIRSIACVSFIQNRDCHSTKSSSIRLRLYESSKFDRYYLNQIFSDCPTFCGDICVLLSDQGTRNATRKIASLKFPQKIWNVVADSFQANGKGGDMLRRMFQKSPRSIQNILEGVRKL